MAQLYERLGKGEMGGESGDGDGVGRGVLGVCEAIDETNEGEGEGGALSGVREGGWSGGGMLPVAGEELGEDRRALDAVGNAAADAPDLDLRQATRESGDV
jgi:hypothetical protein